MISMILNDVRKMEDRREQIQADVEAFLADGGEIERLPTQEYQGPITDWREKSKALYPHKQAIAEDKRRNIRPLVDRVYD